MARNKKPQPEPIVCSYCPQDEINETVEGETEGWVQTEYGMKCPECRFVRDMVDTGTSSIGADPLVAAIQNDNK